MDKVCTHVRRGPHPCPSQTSSGLADKLVLAIWLSTDRHRPMTLTTRVDQLPITSHWLPPAASPRQEIRHSSRSTCILIAEVPDASARSSADRPWSGDLHPKALPRPPQSIPPGLGLLGELGARVRRAPPFRGALWSRARQHERTLDWAVWRSWRHRSASRRRLAIRYGAPLAIAAPDHPASPEDHSAWNVTAGPGEGPGPRLRLAPRGQPTPRSASASRGALRRARWRSACCGSRWSVAANPPVDNRACGPVRVLVRRLSLHDRREHCFLPRWWLEAMSDNVDQLPAESGRIPPARRCARQGEIASDIRRQVVCAVALET
jgi:hypothetical protein